MFQANVPEKIIQKTTGHRSIEVLRGCERISQEQRQAVTRVLMSSNAKTSYSREVETVQPIPRQGDVRESLAGILALYRTAPLEKSQ